MQVSIYEIIQATINMFYQTLICFSQNFIMIRQKSAANMFEILQSTEKKIRENFATFST